MASPILAGKLSSQVVFNWTCMRVFGPSWERGYVSDVEGEKEDFERNEGEEDGELQSRVLRCRWASLDVLLRAQEGWIERFARNRVLNPICKSFPSPISYMDLLTQHHRFPQGEKHCL